MWQWFFDPDERRELDANDDDVADLLHAARMVVGWPETPRAVERAVVRDRANDPVARIRRRVGGPHGALQPVAAKPFTVCFARPHAHNVQIGDRIAATKA